MSQDYINQFTKFLISLQIANKLYHWNTLSYSRHIASDTFQTSLLELTDRFIETFIGRYHIQPNFSSLSIPVVSDHDTSVYQEARKILKNMNHFIKDSELLAIRDDLLSNLEQMMYRMRFD